MFFHFFPSFSSRYYLVTVFLHLIAFLFFALDDRLDTYCFIPYPNATALFKLQLTGLFIPNFRIVDVRTVTSFGQSRPSNTVVGQVQYRTYQKLNYSKLYSALQHKLDLLLFYAGIWQSVSRRATRILQIHASSPIALWLLVIVEIRKQQLDFTYNPFLTETLEAF